MKKMLLAAIVATLAVSLAPAQAEPGRGCNTGGAAEDAGIVCEFVSTGAATTWFAATPNHYTITRTYVDPVDGLTKTQVLVDEDSLQAPTQDELTGIAADDKITVTMGPDDAEGFVNGAIGIVGAYETE